METPLTEERPHRALRLYWRTLRGAGLLQLFAWSAEGVTNHTFNARRDHSRSRRAADSWITDHVGAQIPVSMDPRDALSTKTKFLSDACESKGEQWTQVPGPAAAFDPDDDTNDDDAVRCHIQ